MTFDSFRTIFIFLIVVLVITTLIIVLQKKESKLLNGFSVVSISVICLAVTTMLIYQEGYIVDVFSLNGQPLSGDFISSYLGIAIGIICLSNPFIYLFKNKLY
ncbi:hypothetical protein [Pseudalkalibacillus sp. NRS-1564]|uniref:hypothetical protein n=1 Tax=Pseudalkalibacillus sp. NRS-1564 TaxID=3233900 RepID=UPI003D2AA938